MKLLKHKDDKPYHSKKTLDHREEDREWDGAPVAWKDRKSASWPEKDEDEEESKRGAAVKPNNKP